MPNASKVKISAMKKSYIALIVACSVLGLVIAPFFSSGMWLIGGFLGALVGFVFVTLYDCHWNPMAVFDFED